jgi:D-alanyl-lipoteichoic acid acyltransferase DltB (MBOAT superfamily)
MLFNSYAYLFVFLPVAVLGYFAAWRHSSLALAWLVAVSLAFYGWWNPWHLPLILGSVVINFLIGERIKLSQSRKRFWLIAGIAANLALLGVFKYARFAAESINAITAGTLPLPAVALPLGISFFTFTQMAYLADTARGDVRESNPLHYGLFVTFFPHLLSGPIIHHREMMPQFANDAGRRFDAANFSRGLFLLALGFGKKVLIADPLGETANAGYANIGGLDLAGAWTTTLAYTFQIYFDFSGYTDMALGAALMFNIRLPVNFNSPYLSTNIQDFWRRWHITLSRFLRDYLYIPLGGNRAGEVRIATNLLATFLLGGLWHGAGWTFIVWGGLHGLALVVHRIWQRLGFRLPEVLAIFLTFLFVHVTWILFRARDLADAMLMAAKLVPTGADLAAAAPRFPTSLSVGLPYSAPSPGLLLIAAACVVLVRTNSDRLAQRFAARNWEAGYAALLLALSVLTLSQVTQFLYFNF